MNILGIYERCKSRELITLFNKQSLCVSYKGMEWYWLDLAKYIAKKRISHANLLSQVLLNHLVLYK